MCHIDHQRISNLRAFYETAPWHQINRTHSDVHQEEHNAAQRAE